MSELEIASTTQIILGIFVPSRGVVYLNGQISTLWLKRQCCFRPLTGSRASEQVGGIVTKMVHGRFRPLTGSKVSER